MQQALALEDQSVAYRAIKYGIGNGRNDGQPIGDKGRATPMPISLIPTSSCLGADNQGESAFSRLSRYTCPSRNRLRVRDEQIQPQALGQELGDELTPNTVTGVVERRGEGAQSTLAR